MSWRSRVLALTALGTLAACSSTGSGAPSPSSPPASPPSTDVTVQVAPTAVAPVTVTPPVATSSPTTPSGSGPSSVSGVVPAGFGTVAGRVTAADGSICEVCLWSASTPEQRARGLMGVTDLGGADGMVFRWDQATTGGFWMRDTLVPLSVAFFATDGTFVSATDMTPCPPDTACPSYVATGPYRDAVEVPAGQLAGLLMVPGSRLDVLAEGCPLAGRTS